MKKNFFLLILILLNVVLTFVLASNLQKPLYNELSKDEITTLNPSTSSDQNNKIIGVESEGNFSFRKVVKVIDGDTIVLEDGKTLRYIGIDSPEISKGDECLANQAKIRNEELVLGKVVRLEKDVSEVDKYGRYLRYVYLQDTFVNKTLVLEGYAKAVTYPTDVKYSQILKEAEREARLNNRGLWGKCVSETMSLPENLKVEKDLEQSSGLGQEGVYCNENIYNCSDFKTQKEAQFVFDNCGGNANDVHKLDSDKDGKACESLP